MSCFLFKQPTDHKMEPRGAKSVSSCVFIYPVKYFKISLVLTNQNTNNQTGNTRHVSQQLATAL